MLHGARLQLQGWHCRIALTHVAGPRRVAAIVQDARREAGDGAANARQAALEKLRKGEPLVKGKVREGTALLEMLQQRAQKQDWGHEAARTKAVHTAQVVPRRLLLLSAPY